MVVDWTQREVNCDPEILSIFFSFHQKQLYIQLQGIWTLQFYNHFKFCLYTNVFGVFFGLISQIQTGELKELFTTGNTSQVEPTITKLSEDLMALGRDNMSIIIDSEGEPAKKYALRWSDVPTVLGMHAYIFLSTFMVHLAVVYSFVQVFLNFYCQVFKMTERRKKNKC